jgi:hypothetical protein
MPMGMYRGLACSNRIVLHYIPYKKQPTMCRYAMVSYKPHFACFNCRKTFKRRLLNDVDRDETESVAAKCPECGQLMADMGLDFESPKKKDVKAWEHLKTLYAVGITFHSCGCSGPGYIPSSTEALVAYFTNILMLVTVQFLGRIIRWLFFLISSFFYCLN